MIDWGSHLIEIGKIREGIQRMGVQNQELWFGHYRAPIVQQVQMICRHVDQTCKNIIHQEKLKKTGPGQLCEFPDAPHTLG